MIAELASVSWLVIFEHKFDNERMPVALATQPASHLGVADGAQWREAADDALLPVLPPLRSLLPGLRRGHVVAVEQSGVLALALLAGPSSAGSWCAVVGVPEFGAQAATELGVELNRVVLVSDPGEQWAEVVAALLGAVEVVFVRPSGQVPVSLARRLMAKARKQGSALIVAGSWGGAQTRLRVASVLWTGTREQGRGYLRSRRVHVESSGRGAGGRPHSAWLWLPGPDGSVAAADLEAA